MTDKQIYFAFSEAANYNDIDAFVSDVAISSCMEDIEIDNALIEALKNIYECYHMTFKDVLERIKLSQTEFAIRYMIPLRTVQHWVNGDRAIPLYLKIMFCEIEGIWYRVKPHATEL